MIPAVPSASSRPAALPRSREGHHGHEGQHEHHDPDDHKACLASREEGHADRHDRDEVERDHASHHSDADEAKHHDRGRERRPERGEPERVDARLDEPEHGASRTATMVTRTVDLRKRLSNGRPNSRMLPMAMAPPALSSGRRSGRASLSAVTYPASSENQAPETRAASSWNAASTPSSTKPRA